MSIEQTRERVIVAALHLTASRCWADAHPSDSHAADDVVRRDEMLNMALDQYVTAAVSHDMTGA